MTPDVHQHGFGLWIGAVLDRPADLIEGTDDFWSRALGWEVGQPWRSHPEFHHIDPQTGHSHVLVQTIEGPPRVHLDLYAADVEAVCDALVSLGATVQSRHEHWQVLTSPGGFPHCVVTADGEQDRPTARTWPGGHRSRLTRSVSTFRTDGWTTRRASGAPRPAGLSSRRSQRSSPAI